MSHSATAARVRHAQLHRAQSLFDRVAPRERWRGCVGMALLLSNVNQTHYHGKRA